MAKKRTASTAARKPAIDELTERYDEYREKELANLHSFHVDSIDMTYYFRKADVFEMSWSATNLKGNIEAGGAAMCRWFMLRALNEAGEKLFPGRPADEEIGKVMRVMVAKDIVDIVVFLGDIDLEGIKETSPEKAEKN